MTGKHGISKIGSRCASEQHEQYVEKILKRIDPDLYLQKVEPRAFPISDEDMHELQQDCKLREIYRRIVNAFHGG